MQSASTNCYDRAISSLDKYSSLESEERIGIIRRAVAKLKEQKENSSMEDELKEHAPAVLNKIQASDRQDTTVMKIITEEFFSTIKNADGQIFEKTAPDVYSLNAKSGTYVFEVHYTSESNYITLIRKPTKGKRPSQIESFIFNKLPKFESTNTDVKIIEENFRKMLKKLARCWKYLNNSRSPSQSTSNSSTDLSLSQEDNNEVLSEFLNDLS